MKKCVAVIMPFHNGMIDFMIPAVDGIISQLVNAQVYLILCDNSDDGTDLRIESYIKAKLKTATITSFVSYEIIKVKERGVAFARNAGLDHVEHCDFYDYVAFCDCDDVWRPDHLQKSLIYLQDRLVEGVYSDVRVVDESGNQLQVYGIPYHMNFHRANLEKQNFIYISTVVVKATSVYFIRFDHDTDPMGDWDFWLQFTETNDFYHVPVTTVDYLWKTKTGSYYGPERMIEAAKKVKIKHKLMNDNNYEPSDGFADELSVWRRKKQSVPGWLTETEGALLQKYARSKVCLEVGSYKGKSANYIAEVAESLTCIDTFKCDDSGQNQVEKSILMEFMQNTSDYADKITPIIGDSAKVHVNLQNDHYDMVFIDAMHDYDSVKRDITNYLPKIKDEGILLLHDYNNQDYPGVKKAANELLGLPSGFADSIAYYVVVKDVFKKVMRDSFVEALVEQSKEDGKLDVVDVTNKILTRELEKTALSSKVVVIAPFARKLPNGNPNPKNPPLKFWKELLAELHDAGIYTIQVGESGEPFIGAHEVCFNLVQSSLDDLLEKRADFFISVDSFFQHFATYKNKKGVVIFSQSDPKIFGHSSNVNILKSTEYLRPMQYQRWDQTPYIEDAFPSVNQVVEGLLKLIDRV